MVKIVYDTFKDLYIDNPWKVDQILTFLTKNGKSLEQAKKEVKDYIMTQDVHFQQ